MARSRALALVVCVAGCNGGAFKSNCTAGAPGMGAALPAASSGTTAILPGGRQVTPAGTLLDVGGFPIALRILPGDRYAVVSDDATDDEKLRIVDLQAPDPLNPVAFAIDYPIGMGKASPGMLYGLALSADGTKLYVSNGGQDVTPGSTPAAMHYNTIQVYDVAGTPPTLQEDKQLSPIKLMFDGIKERVPTGIALSADGKLLYAACQYDDSLAIVSLANDATYGTEIGRAAINGVSPYDVAVDESSHTAFVSLWGGDGKTNGVVPVDVTDPTMPVAGATISTGKAAEAELLLAGRLFVANADADTVSIVDTAARTVKSLPATSGMILGATPTSVAIEPAGANGNGRIYLANAGENSVVALDLDTMSIIGRVPTAWYPTAVAVLGDGTLVIASARGLSIGPTDGTPAPRYSAGTIQVVPRPSDADLASGDKLVAANLDRPHALEPPLTCPASGTPAFPLPAKPGAPTPIKYVFLVVRENKTYDGVLGDLEGGNGMASMVMFGKDVTPNAHALAKQFVILDNFYSHAELSVQGHEWTTSCIANDYTEKSWGHSDDYGRAYIPPLPWGPPSSLSNLVIPGAGDIWSHLDKAGVPYHNYGEVVNGGDAKTLADPQYPGVFFNTNIDDNNKTDYVLSVITDPKYKLEPFSYFLLPNDHTNGTSPGAQTPSSMVANNDEATGRFIDGLSHSSLWGQSIVFVVEDDPGSLPDHVEGHRSLCLVASPWIKRGYRSSTNFDLGSVYHTIEMILGVGPMNLNDGHAAGMYELFTPTADMTPFVHVPRTYPVTYNSVDAPMAKESMQVDWSRPDTADVTRILWKATHGKDAEPPNANRKLVRTRLDDDDD
jgi:YVTN family beta-propeller protein